MGKIFCALKLTCNIYKRDEEFSYLRRSKEEFKDRKTLIYTLESKWILKVFAFRYKSDRIRYNQEFYRNAFWKF